VTAVALVFPHQLFERHPALDDVDAVWLIEDPLFFGTDRDWPLAVHKHRLVLHRASMRAWAAEQRALGRRIHYVELPPGDSVDAVGLWRCALPEETTEIHVADPVDDVLSQRLRAFARQRAARVRVHETPNFLTSSETVARQVGGRRRPFMASFYRGQRQRLGILVEGQGEPAGGQWSFDAANRKRLPRECAVPPEPRASGNAWVREARSWVAARFPGNPGDVNDFALPVTRAAARTWQEAFVVDRLHGFGDYEDAIARRHRVIFHSMLSPLLNIGLLDPRSVVDAVLARGKSRKIPLNCVEGFVRQVIGWREFIRGIYVHFGRRIRTRNFWGFERRMPAAILRGETGIPPVDDTIRRVLQHGWCHHIERLMILGNFMLLCRIHPDDVYRWFMAHFVDAYDWVMVPNVYGMSQFADGGVFATKPYLSGANYILKMSDYRRGPWCATWDGLFWTFIADHRRFFLGNHRMAMLVRTWDKMTAGRQQSHQQAASEFLCRLDDR